MIEIQVVPEGPKALEVEAEGWWNDDHDVYTWPVRVGKWGAKIECHGSTPMEAQALALYVVTAIGASGKAAPVPEIESPTTVGALILGGAVSSTELGDNDVTLDSQVVERIQRELVKDSEDLAVELMLVGQHYRILQALRAEVDDAKARQEHAESVGDNLANALQATQARVAELESVPTRHQSLCAKHAEVIRERDELRERLEKLEQQEPFAFYYHGEPGYTALLLAGMPEPKGEGFPHITRKLPLYAAPVAQAGQVPEEVRILLARAQGQIEHLAECTENLGEDLEDDDVSEDVAEAREVAEEIGAYLAGAPAQGVSDA